ncbi:MAG TPA: hypothetical protein P5186_28135 [Candidatus Paceibacterota bacterium]|nr:hypothetical protein [Verrucomicrobiota bacterium]HRY51919.1 hypothetical protein [Candidatus Paceibacterota bacterium]
MVLTPLPYFGFDPIALLGFDPIALLYDGSALTIQEVLTLKNRRNQQGRSSHLSWQQLEDLGTYILSIPDGQPRGNP